MIEVYSPQRLNVRRPRITDAQRQRVIAEVCRAARGVERLMPVIYCGEVLAWIGWSHRHQQVAVVEHHPWMRTWVDRNGLLCGFANIDGIINATTQSAQMRQLMWSKTTINSATNTENWQHLISLAGFPSPSNYNGTAGVGYRHDDTELGALMHGGNVSPKTKHIISGFVRSGPGSASVNIFVWYDLVLSYDNCLASSTQLNFNNTTAPARYVGGGDPGLQIMSAQTANGAGGTNFTQIKYTNQAGTSGQVVPAPSMVNPFSSSGPPNESVAAQSAFAATNTDTRSILSPALVNGDTGVRQLDSVTMSGNPSPTELISYLLGFQLCWLANHVGTEDTYPFDFVKQMPSLVQVRDGACLQLAQWCAQSSTIWHGSLNVAWA